jgi:putative salt-induced outer membrane protein
MHRDYRVDIQERLAAAELRRYRTAAMRALLPLVAAMWACSAIPGSAAIPEPVRAMIAALAGVDSQVVATVIALAKKTNPDDADAIEELHEDFRRQQSELAAAKKAEEEKALRSAGLFERWTGRGEIGGSRATGNSETLGLTGAISLNRRGIDWSHRVSARADFQQDSGRTRREKFFADYEPRFDLRDDLFLYGLAQYERDRLQGTAARYALSGGLGYKILESASMDLSIKAGPAVRLTRTTDGVSDTRVAGLFGLDFDWQVIERLKFTQDVNAVAETGGAALLLVDSQSTTLRLVSGIEAKVTDRLSTRMSYALDYDSEPLPGKRTTDTVTRFSFVYGF